MWIHFYAFNICFNMLIFYWSSVGILKVIYKLNYIFICSVFVNVQTEQNCVFFMTKRHIWIDHFVSDEKTCFCISHVDVFV